LEESPRGFDQAAFDELEVAVHKDGEGHGEEFGLVCFQGVACPGLQFIVASMVERGVRQLHGAKEQRILVRLPNTLAQQALVCWGATLRGGGALAALPILFGAALGGVRLVLLIMLGHLRVAALLQPVQHPFFLLCLLHGGGAAWCSYYAAAM